MLLIVVPSRHRSVQLSTTGMVGLMLVLPAAIAVLLPTAPAAAEHNCTVVEAPLPNGGYRVVRECPPHQDDGGGGGGDGGDEGGRLEVTCDKYVLFERTGQLLDDLGRALKPVEYVCSDGTSWTQTECIPFLNPDPPGPACDSGAAAGPSPQEIFDGLLQQATGRVDPPLPGLRHTFDQPADDGSLRAIVNAETWWWAEQSAEPVVVYDEDGPVWVRVTATPGVLEIDPGDGSGSLACASQLPYNRHISYYDQIPGEPKGACVHVYEQVADQVTATMSVTWTLTYEGSAPGLGTLSGSLGTQTRQQTSTFPVREIQSVIVR